MLYFSLISPVPSAPTKLDAVPLNDSSIVVTWEPPEKLNGVLTGYSLTWYDIGISSMTTMESPMTVFDFAKIQSRTTAEIQIPDSTRTTVQTTNTSYHVVGLTNCQSYQFSVLAKTNAGQGNKTAITRSVASGERC